MIIPAIDLIDGQTVRLYQGSYDQTTHYTQTPFELRDRYAAAGAGVLHLVDLSGAKDASQRQTALLRELMQQSPLPVQVGGGVRSEADLVTLLEAGASRVVIGSLAIRQSALVQQWLKQYGGERIVLALDVSINEKGEKVLNAIKIGDMISVLINFLIVKNTTHYQPNLFPSIQTASMELVTGGNKYFTSYDSPETFNMKYKYAFSQCLRGIMW